MNFSGATFLLFFLPITILIYKCLPVKVRNLFLTLASLVFCMFAGVISTIVIILSILINFLFGYFLVRCRGTGKARIFLILSVCMNLLTLAFFKYTGMFIHVFSIIWPLGISFYTFHAISYSVDLYKGAPACGIIDFFTYMVMFPKLIQGPIVKYKQLQPQLNNKKVNSIALSIGIRRFICGLSKKVLLANLLFDLYKELWKNIAINGAISAWVCLAAYMLFIYFDFSGYTDMAIGIGKMLGYDFPENFRYPYAATSITDFWRRWHITLSTWFRDYLYIPLGGNRKGTARTVLNLFIVWSLTGLWHGASWNFLFWGVYYFILLVIEKFLFKGKIEKIKGLNHIFVVFFVGLGWILFSCTSFSDIGLFFYSLFNWSNLINTNAISICISYIPVIMIAMIGCLPYVAKFYQKILSNKKLYWIDIVVSVCCIILCFAAIIGGSNRPFLYAAI